MARGARRSSSTAVPLALVWWALIVYASLFPFEDWNTVPGATLPELLRLPWPRYFIPFDITSNLLGYLPLGFLVALWRLRHGVDRWGSLGVAVLAGALTSYTLEVAQHLLPQRVPSLLDWALNALGALRWARWLALVAQRPPAALRALASCCGERWVSSMGMLARP